MDKIISLQEQIFDIIEEERGSLEKEMSLLSKKRAEWEEYEHMFSSVTFPQRIKLDIGGEVFSTSIDTLRYHPQSFFGAMFSGRFSVEPQDDGTYFIDRDPFVFRHILNYMRGRDIHMEFLDAPEKIALKEDAEFYNLDGLLDLLSPSVQWDTSGEGDWDIAKGRDLWEISQNGKCARKVKKPSYITVIRTKQLVYKFGATSPIIINILIVGREREQPVSFDFQLGLVEHTFTSEKEWLRNAPGVFLFVDLRDHCKAGDIVKIIIDHQRTIKYQIGNGQKIETNKTVYSDLYLALAIREVDFGAEIVKIENLKRSEANFHEISDSTDD